MFNWIKNIICRKNGLQLEQEELEAWRIEHDKELERKRLQLEQEELEKLRLDREQHSKEKILSLLEEKWPKNKRKCGTCGNKKWTVASDIWGILPFRRNKYVVSGENVYPCITLTCNNCSDTKFFNAIILGLKDEQ